MKKEKVEEKREVGLYRVLYTLLYLIIGRLISLVLFIIVVTQFIYTWLTGAPNDKLLHFTASLCEYAKQLIAYVAFNSEEKPWPAGEWPSH